MHNFKLLKDDNTTLLFNSCFIDKEDIQYAVDHRFNILYTETSCTDTFSYISQLLDLGYTLEVIKHPQYAQGLKLDDKLYAKFIYHDIDKTEKRRNISKENSISSDSEYINKAEKYNNSVKIKDWRCF